jgi:D-amino-acid dehydrogenase
MQGTGKKSAIVIGAGIVGVCCGIELRRRDFDVTFIDRVEPGESCSFGNAGILASQSVVPVAMPGLLSQVPRMLLDPNGPLVVRWRSLPKTLPWLLEFTRTANEEKVNRTSDAMKSLYSTTVELHEQLAREAGVLELVVSARYLYVARDPRNADIENGFAWKLRRERGTQIEVFDGPALREIEPELSPVYTRGVRVGPMARTTNPFRLTRAYADLLRRQGGNFMRAEVHALRSAGDVVDVETSAGRQRAGIVVVAGGAWSMNLLKPLGLRLPLIAERGYHMTFANPGVKIQHAISELERHFAVSSMEMGLRFAGTEELSVADDAPSWRRAEVLARVGKEMFPHLNVEEGSRWSGPRAGIPDSLPGMGPIPGHPNILLAFGHGHLGLTGGPNSGRIVAGLAAGERINMDLAPFAPDRFMTRGRSASRALAEAGAN